MMLRDVSNIAQLAPIVRFPFCILCSAMASSGHRDVNLPPSTWHRAGGFLAEFGAWLQELGYSTWTIDKGPGNHLTNFWLYTRMDSSAPTKSQVQFGCTKFASVNPRIHAYARGKAPHLSAAVKLLENFMDQVWALEGQVTDAGVTTMVPAAQHPSWDQFEVLDLMQYRCPSTERVWFSNDDASFWFMPDSSDSCSTCGRWKKYQDSLSGAWWSNEDARKLFFLAAA